MESSVAVVGPSKHFLSGISYYTIGLANALSKEANVSVVCLRKLLPRFLFPGRHRVGHEISAMSLDEDVDVFDGVDYDNPLSWNAARSFLERKRPGTLILQWWTSSVAHMLAILGKAGKRIGSTVIVELHETADPIENGNPLLRIYSRVAGKLVFSTADHFVAHSESDKKNAATAYGLDPERISVIPQVICGNYASDLDEDTARRMLGLEKTFVILSFGLIRDYKGIPFLLEAFNSLPRDVAKASQLLLVGEVWESRESLMKSISQSPYRDRIQLIDRYVPDSDVSLYFTAADVVCLPYLRASQSGVARTAAEFGKPVILSRIGGLSESMAAYEGSRFVHPRDSEGIKQHLLELWNQWDSGRYSRYPSPVNDWNDAVAFYKGIFRAAPIC